MIGHFLSLTQTKAISQDCDPIAAKLGDPIDRTYIDTDAQGSMWGWNGSPF